ERLPIAAQVRPLRGERAALIGAGQAAQVAVVDARADEEALGARGELRGSGVLVGIVAARRGGPGLRSVLRGGVAALGFGGAPVPCRLAELLPGGARGAGDDDGEARGDARRTVTKSEGVHSP